MARRSPKRKRVKRWIKGALGKHPGALHRYFRIPRGEVIPVKTLLRGKAKVRRMMEKARTKAKRKKALKIFRRIQAVLNVRGLGKKRKRHVV